MRSSGRVVAVDLARGTALAGMMLAHLGPVQVGDVAPINEIVSAGRAAPLFALLAGVSLTLVQRRDARGAGSVRATIVRGLLLVLLGLSLGSLRDMPVLIILAVYGLLVMAALPLRGLSTRTLVALTAAWAVLAPVGLLALRIHHDPVLSEQPSWSDVQDPWRLISTILFWGGYPAAVWMAYVLAGLVIGRLDLTGRVTAARLAVGGGVAVVATLTVAWLRDRDWAALFDHDTYPYDPAAWDDLWLVGPHTSMPLNVVGSIGSAALVIGLAGLVVRFREGAQPPRTGQRGGCHDLDPLHGPRALDVAPAPGRGRPRAGQLGRVGAPGRRALRSRRAVPTPVATRPARAGSCGGCRSTCGGCCGP